jgi:hypothetical protein
MSEQINLEAENENIKDIQDENPNPNPNPNVLEEEPIEEELVVPEEEVIEEDVIEKKQDVILLKLGDIILISDPTNEILNDNVFLIEYIDPKKIKLIKSETF